jgi:ATP-dependent exoDNAse (exonuclease V) beta subunit
VHTSAGENSVTVQTIHATKGLEHPIVIVANMNSGRFPPSSRGGQTILYDDAIGLRQRTVYDETHGQPYLYDNWKVDILRKSLARDYDEERRLLYVAITRAESHVLFTAGEDPNTFLEELPVEVDQGNPNVPDFDVTPDEKQMLDISLPDRVGPAGYSPHSLMDDTVYEEVEGGEGMEFGTRVHEFAERYCLGEEVDPRNNDERRVQSLLDSFSGELHPEENAYLPLDTEQGRVTLSGVIDLLHITPDTVDIIDYKTDRGRHAESEYRKQLSVYYHILTELYPERTIQPFIFYTQSGENVAIDPLSKSDLAALVVETGIETT